MKRLPVLAILVCLASPVSIIAEGQPSGFRLDLSLGGSMPLSWYCGGPTLPHLGWAGSVGAEYDLPDWIPCRFEIAGFGDGASAISSSGELYKAWDGLRFAAYGGYRASPFKSLAGARLDLLAGGALTAAGYADTNLAFAYPSLLALVRLDQRPSAKNGLVFGLPLEYMFRGELATFSAGAFLSWRMGPLDARLPKKAAGRPVKGKAK